MTPKEKAKQLVKKFDKAVNTITNTPLKKCALIAVEEILFSNNTIFETNIPHECWKYWQEVKQEINKL